MIIAKLSIRSNEGYNPIDAIECVKTMTVGQLRQMLADYEDNTPIATYDLNNSRGACWGIVFDVEEIERCDDDEY